MSALTPKAQAIVWEGRAALLPAAGERERIEALLDARLSAMAPTPRLDAAPPLRAAGWRFVTPLAIGIALVGVGVFSSRARAPSVAPQRPPSVAPVASAPPPEPPAAAPALVAAPEPPAQVVAEPRDPPIAAPSAPDRLAQEVALLSRATSALRAGRAAEAMKLLDEHQRKFPKGVLGEERRGARAQALCGLKRVTEGRAELAHLAPQSPAAARAKQICDAASAASDGQ